MTSTAYSLTESLDRKVQILHNNIAYLQKQATAEGASEQVISTLCAPYLKLLKTVYTEEYPLAKAIEDSDILIHLEGPLVNTSSPSVAVITDAFQRVRTQVARVAKAIAQMSPTKRTIPREIDLGLSAFAKGSLILGFSLPSPTGLREGEAGQVNLYGEDDLLYQAAREAIKTIGSATEHLGQNPTEKGIEALESVIPDAQVRDVTLNAISRLAPTGKGITKVGIGGKSVGSDREVHLTPKLKESLRKHLANPVKKKDPGFFIGDVREADLDAHRFELRNIEGESIASLRCSYTDQPESVVKGWLGQRVKAIGHVARDKEGNPRLLAITTIEVVELPNRQMTLL